MTDETPSLQGIRDRLLKHLDTAVSDLGRDLDAVSHPPAAADRARFTASGWRVSVVRRTRTSAERRCAATAPPCGRCRRLTA